MIDYIGTEEKWQIEYELIKQALENTLSTQKYETKKQLEEK